MIRLATVDNHEVVREGVAARISAVAPQIEVVASTGTVEELLALDAEPTVVLLDLWLEEGDSLAHIPVLTARTRVLLYTTEQRPVPLRAAVSLGASGLSLKSDPLDSVVEGVGSVAAGEFFCSGALAHALLTDQRAVAELSDRQVEILQALSDGLDYRGVAALLDCSQGAVKTHLSRVRDKFEAIGHQPGNSHHLTRLATEQGYLQRS
ncbi:response regulator transcription factor [Nocardioides nanhaiensis]|uniref:Response regulator transcription factor n=1 Tax=Nocardioides nanhaiensis TaxID=1476871 RepID=A0ABP8WY79_9ACTN